MISALKIPLCLLQGDNSGVDKGGSRERCEETIKVSRHEMMAATPVAAVIRGGTHPEGGLCRIWSLAEKGQEGQLHSFYWARMTNGGAIY